MFPQLFPTFLFSGGFHDISCLPVKSGRKIDYVVFVIFDSLRCLIFFWTFCVISYIFPPFSTFDFIFSATLMILPLLFSFILSVVCRFMSSVLFILLLLFSHIHFACFDIVISVFSLFFNCMTPFLGFCLKTFSTSLVLFWTSSDHLWCLLELFLSVTLHLPILHFL